MIIVISGQPGNGKTLRAMALMLEEYERNQQKNKLPTDHKEWEELREFYTNIAGATLQDELTPNEDAFPWVKPIPADNDWRKLPSGSYVLYDEAHSDGTSKELERYGKLFPSTGRPGESDDPRIRDMSAHRHRGYDIVLMTQWPSKIHHNVRQLAGKHIHMNRALGLQRAGTFTWTRVQPDPYDERERQKAEEEIWAYPTDLYKRYKSASLHTATYKFRIPKKAWQALSMLLMMAVVGWCLWLFVFKSDAPEKELAAVAEGQAPSGAAAPPRVVEKEDDRDEPRWESPEAYAIDHRPRLIDRPWTAPIFDDREATADPLLMCMSTVGGEGNTGEWKDADCVCFTEQGTRYLLDQGRCKIVARHGAPYNPYRERSQASAPQQVADVQPGAMPSTATAVGLGDSSVLVQPQGGMRGEQGSTEPYPTTM